MKMLNHSKSVITHFNPVATKRQPGHTVYSRGNEETGGTHSLLPHDQREKRDTQFTPARPTGEAGHTHTHTHTQRHWA